MRYIPLLFLASPAMAHDGVPAHSDGFEALLSLDAASVLVHSGAQR